MVSQPASATAAPTAGTSWLHGSVPDLLFGAGLAYLVTIPLLTLWSGAGGAWSSDMTVALALLVSGPHYGATLLRVYERRADRRKYEFFALYITLGLLALLGLGLESVLVGSLLVTAYVTWSPWHFAGQNYGIALMFLRRRGVGIPPSFKRWFYVSFVLSALLAMLSIHRAGSLLIYAQGANAFGAYDVVRAGLPPGAVFWLAVAVGSAYLASLAAAVTFLLRGGARLRDLAEPGLLVATQALWFALPAVGAMTEMYQLAGLAFAPIWISTAHAVQYLWVTSYYARRSDSRATLLPFLTKALLAGALLTILPNLLLAPPLLGGQLSHYAGAGLLVFSVVNLHHFLLDGAVWKLRDGRVASVLLRTGAGPAAGAEENEGRGWLRPAVWTLGGVCVVVAAYVGVAPTLALSSRVPLPEMERANRVLTWLGHGEPGGWVSLAERYIARGEMEPAIDAYRRCVEVVRSQLGHPPGPDLSNRLATLLLGTRRSDPASVEEARQLVQGALEREPANLRSLELLIDAHAASGDLQAARALVPRAARVAEAEGDGERIAALERRLEGLAAKRGQRAAALGSGAPAGLP